MQIRLELVKVCIRASLAPVWHCIHYDPPTNPLIQVFLVSVLPFIEADVS